MLNTTMMLVSLACIIVILSSTPTSATEGIVISGGDDTSAYKSVEVYVPSTGMSCLLPALPENRIYHTMDDLTVCGGTYTKETCVSFISGEWVTSQPLVHQRMVHCSWQTEEGLLLLGGGNQPLTSEIVPLSGQDGGLSFDMQYDTRNACSMRDLTSSSLIITGGYKTKHTVSRYDSQGFVEDLPSLVKGRSKHGCASYLREDGTQVLLVAGGDNGGYLNDHEASTEVLTADSSTWTLANPLPTALIGLQGVTLGGRVYMTGGYTEDDDLVSDILVWLDEEQAWEEAGEMRVARGIHAVATINMDHEAMQFCS